MAGSRLPDPPPAKGPRPDAIFVFAGGQARKECAAGLWQVLMHASDAPEMALVVSVARFEWRRYALLGLPGVDALQEAVDVVPPEQRHFFVILERNNVEVRHVTPRRWGTRNEARALAGLVAERGWRNLLVITSKFHLARVRWVVRRALAGRGVAVVYATPSRGADPHGPGRWFRTRRGIRLVASEQVKRLVYRFLKP
ncbi:MAG TPA: hypothetical protein VFM00_10395 [Candidatus Eisenbacteria bacterium]|nr:hypothetical protein [Candidatus Eisenbacteria bacterium]